MDEKIDSGLSNLVIPPRGATTDVPSPPPSVPAITTTLTPQKIAKLARELAVNIRAPKDILADFGLTPEQFDAFIKPNPLFTHALQALIAEWNDAGNAPKRLRLQAQAILEDSMPTVGSRMSDAREDLKDVVSAFKAISQIAGMEGEKTPVGAGEKFTITINLGSDTLKYDKIIGRPQGVIDLIEEKSDAGT